MQKSALCIENSYPIFLAYSLKIKSVDLLSLLTQQCAYLFVNHIQLLLLCIYTEIYPLYAQCISKKHRANIFLEMSSSLNNSTQIVIITINYMEETLYIFEKTMLINKNIPFSVLNLILFVSTVSIVILLNTLVLVWVKVKEKVLIDKMVTLDCVANIMMAGFLLLMFPVRIWNNAWLCIVITFFRSFTVTLKR